jgi:hypothetical protein
MDEKVLKLLERALAENLSDERVSYIMGVNGYDQGSIDAALGELKKKDQAQPSHQSQLERQRLLRHHLQLELQGSQESVFLRVYHYLSQLLLRVYARLSGKFRLNLSFLSLKSRDRN